MQQLEASRAQRILIGVVVVGAVVIAAIGFAGSYAAVRDLAEQKGFGAFAPFFPIGVDAGIIVLLALDLLLTWIRIPFPLLRQTAWLLTAATIAFNGAAAWPDPLGVGMHAVMPVLFVVTVEAARHAIGRIADITADKHMEGVRISRWLLAFPSTFRLWRRMKLWELRSYEQVIAMEQDRLVYESRLRARYGRGWRRKAPVESLMPLRLARYGVPLAETGPSGLTAAGMKSTPLERATTHPTEVPASLTSGTEAGRRSTTPPLSVPEGGHREEAERVPAQYARPTEQYERAPETPVLPRPEPQDSVAKNQHHSTASRPVPEAAGGDEDATALDADQKRFKPTLPHQAEFGERKTEVDPPTRKPDTDARGETEEAPAGATPAMTTVDGYYREWARYQSEHQAEPNDRQLAHHLKEQGLLSRSGRPIAPSTLRRYLPGFRIYHVWLELVEENGAEPSIDELEQLVAKRGITGKYNARLEARDLEPFLDDFRRRLAAMQPHSAAALS